jgi:NitT/TauT family transport system permease protein
LKKILKMIIPIAAWILIWQLVAIIIHNTIILAGPIETLSALAGLVKTDSFWASVWQTTGRILLGFVIGSLLGIVLAYLAHAKSFVADFLKPLVSALKSVPVASFVILLLIWFGSRNISVIIVAMVVFPILYLGTFEGLAATDNKMLEMAHVFRMPLSRQIRYIYVPHLRPFWKSAFKLAIGMSFKSGIAAEVIGQPLNTIGNGLYLSKVYLETGELFAWTIVVVLIAFICEKIVSGILRLF